MPEPTVKQYGWIRQIGLFILSVFIIVGIPALMFNAHPVLQQVAHSDEEAIWHLTVFDNTVWVYQTGAGFYDTQTNYNLVNRRINPDFMLHTVIERSYDVTTFDERVALGSENLLSAENVIIHLVNDETRAFLAQWQPATECTPPSWLTIERWEMCLVSLGNASIISNIVGVFGWSPPESWGMWTIDRRPRAQFYATAERAYQLHLEGFPYCLADERQVATVTINGSPIGEIAWDECETRTFQLPIPANVLVDGENELAFEFAYAVAPADVPTDANNDPRTLAAGFNRILITDVGNE